MSRAENPHVYREMGANAEVKAIHLRTLDFLSLKIYEAPNLEWYSL